MKYGKIIIFCATIILCAGCSHFTVSPKPVVAHSISFSGNTQNAGVIDCDKDGCLVDENWLSHYKLMEKKSKQYLGEDKLIKREGNYWRVTYSILNHYLTLRQAERGA